MANFLVVYLGGNPPSTPEEGKAHFEKYKAWLANLGAAVVSPANPLKDTHSIAADGEHSKGSDIAMSGYTVLSADSIDDAMAMAKACPFLEIGGRLEVSELVQMTI